MGTEGKFEFDSIQDPVSIQDFLQALSDGFGKGRIRLESESEEIILLPAPLLGVSVKAKRKGNENKISIKITWKDAHKLGAPNGKSLLVAS